MTEKSKKSEGPMCSCGRPDLYEESLKLKEKAEVNDSTVANQTADDSSSADMPEDEDQNPGQRKE
jgi:hypothetical protein